MFYDFKLKIFFLISVNLLMHIKYKYNLKHKKRKQSAQKKLYINIHYI